MKTNDNRLLRVGENIRAILNLGHTFGHAIESINNYKSSLTHGEAVSIGIMMALEMSYLEGKISDKDLKKIKSHFQRLNLKIKIPIYIRKKSTLNKFKEIMSSDKKVKNKKINLILINTFGKAYITNKYSKDNLDSTIKKYLN